MMRYQQWAIRAALPAICCLLALLSGCQRLSARFIGVRTIDPVELRAALSRQPAPLVIDLRPEVEYCSGHLPGAIRLNPAGVDGYVVRSGLSQQRVIILVCRSGWYSQVAAATVAAAGFPRVFSLENGIDGLKKAGIPLANDARPAVPAEMLQPPVVPISTLSQLAMTVAAFAIKPAYLLMTLLVIVPLWRQKPRELVLLRRGMLTFFVGEGACALNYLTAANASRWLEFVHGLGMVGTYTLIAGALFVFLDEHVIFYSAAGRRCALHRVCLHCWKNEAVDCGLFRIGLLLLPILAVCALLPLTMPLRPFALIIPVFLSNVLWLKDFWNLLIEFRIYPILGAICALLCLQVFRRGKEGFRQAQPLLFLAVGFTGYAFLRFGLLLTFKENQAWADWWEELSELMLALLVWVFVVVFRQAYNLRLPAPVVAITDRLLPAIPRRRPADN